MATLYLEPNDETVELEDGSRIQEVCEEAGLPFACTEGICGTCVIEVLEGQENLSAPTQEEVDFLGEGNLEERLACQCKINSGSVKLTY